MKILCYYGSESPYAVHDRNRLGLPERVEADDHSRLEHVYSASGELLRRVSTTDKLVVLPAMTMAEYHPASPVHREVHDRCGPFEYTDSVLSRVLFPGGYISGGVAYNFVTDWQGNVRQVVDGSTSNFSFSATGMLTYNGDTKSFSKNLKKVHKGLDKYMKSNDVVEVRFGSNSATDINGKTVAFSTRNEGGAATYFPDDNGATGNCIILIDPKINMLYNVTPINENTFYRYPYGTPDVVRYLRPISLSTNMADMFFHELGHLLYEDYAKVIDYNNHVRKILNLEKRPYDQNHNSKPDPIYRNQ